MAVKALARLITSTGDDRSHDGMVGALIRMVFVVLGVLLRCLVCRLDL